MIKRKLFLGQVRGFSGASCTRQKFRFLIAPAYSAKARYTATNRESALQLHWTDESKIADEISSVQKYRPDSGDDAYFYSTWTVPRQLNGSIAVGVADGIGSLATKGIDPSNMSNSLLEEAELQFSRMQHDDPQSVISPSTLLKDSFTVLRKDAVRFVGSTTACLATVSSQTAVFHASNLGDSGFYVFRQGRLVVQSKPQTRGFNRPCQLRIMPSSMETVLPPSRNKEPFIPAHVEPEEADNIEVQLQHGDVVLLATDGLSDNLYTYDILKCITSEMLRNGNWVINEHHDRIEPASPSKIGLKNPSHLVRQLVNTALHISTDPNYPSPFAANTKHLVGTLSLGGKPDDITALAFVVEKLEG